MCISEFLIFRSSLLKLDLSDLSIILGDTQILSSLKVRYIGVGFDQYLIFHDHISGICKSTHFTCVAPHSTESNMVRALYQFRSF